VARINNTGLSPEDQSMAGFVIELPEASNTKPPRISFRQPLKKSGFDHPRIRFEGEFRPLVLRIVRGRFFQRRSDSTAPIPNTTAMRKLH